ncbi:MAG: hypothetical protein JXA18_01205, partial [Chitinispirillaceae bacterium]|nr:hypothetical protein [Chitinispirillaceae bacterium]
MLFGNEAPFPDNPVCKRCITRPCRRLFSGRMYPGKMIAIHHSEFLSWPCHTPTLKPQEDETGEAAALTDEIEVLSGKVEITNPRWEPVEEAAEGGDPEIPLMGDRVRLLADVKNYPEGAPVSFDIYDVTESTPLRVATIKGTNQGGTASAEWTVEDPQKRGESLKLQFEAGARSKYTQKSDLPWQDKIRCDFVEMPDVLFHHNSAVPCLDEEGVLLGALTAAFSFAKENPDKEIVLFGHTDTSGDPSYNYDLSQWRAEGIKALLDNNQEAWLDVVDIASKVEDYQSILKSLTISQGWNCDPG